MSVNLPHDEIGCEDRKYVEQTLRCVYDDSGRKDDCFLTDSRGSIRVPFAFALQTFHAAHLVREPVVANERAGGFVAQLRPEQELVVSEATNTLRDARSVVVSAYCAFGKTVSAIAIACALGGDVVIVVNRLVILDQWRAAIDRFTRDVTVVVADTATIARQRPIDSVANAQHPRKRTFTIVNAVNVSKLPADYVKRFDFLIVDELHRIVTRELSKALLRFEPAYVLGLSATPFRYDDYERAIEWFFGRARIHRPLWKDHRVYVIDTNFKPTIKRSWKGVNWSVVLDSQAMDAARNELIVSTIVRFPERKTWMILVKRKFHATLLVTEFAKRGVAAVTMMGTQRTFDRSASVLIGTTSKIGDGFDHADVDALCIAADVKQYAEQFLGRCMRRPDVKPVVVDLVDDMQRLREHYAERERVYTLHGGRIVKRINAALVADAP